MAVLKILHNRKLTPLRYKWDDPTQTPLRMVWPLVYPVSPSCCVSCLINLYKEVVPILANLFPNGDWLSLARSSISTQAIAAHLLSSWGLV